ncbi:MAG: hypothetical protein HZB81_03010, partial [Deltaproteobacteria bacterium]|nr:hypothetical protein [Deltaproteobacteria bacterium]
EGFNRGEAAEEEPAASKGEYASIADIDELKKLTTDIEQAGEVAIAVNAELGTRNSEQKNAESLFLIPQSAIRNPHCVIAFCLKPHQAFSVSIPPLLAHSALETIKPVIEDEGIKKMSCDVKGVHLFFKRYNICMKGAHFDAGIASYLLNPSRSSHTLEDIAYEQLGYKIKGQGVRGKGQDSDEDAICNQACAEADAVFQLSQKMLPQLENEGLLKLFNEIEMPLAEVLAEMELDGIRIDKDYLSTRWHKD